MEENRLAKCTSGLSEQEREKSLRCRDSIKYKEGENNEKRCGPYCSEGNMTYAGWRELKRNTSVKVEVDR